jgi:glycosyltransferase involved in cell wall biosynthesis
MKLTYIFNREITSDKASLVQAVHMCNAFASNGVDVLMALPRFQGQSKVPDDYLMKRFGIKTKFNVCYYSKIKLFNRLGIIGSYFGIRKLLSKKITTDIYFTRCSLIFTILSKKKLPVIYESHNATIHKDSEIYNRFWINKVIKSSQMSSCLAFIAISENLGKYWSAKGVPPEKVLALHDGFDKEMFNESVDKIKARSILNLPLHKKLITYTGSLYPDREIENIIMLAKYFPDELFVVVGGPKKNAADYQALASMENINNIMFTGPVEHREIPIYLYASDVLLALWSKKVPTINYCSPLKVFEYMASGCIMIAHGFPTIKEVVRHNENGLLVEPDNFNDLVEKTRIALNRNTHFEFIGNQAREEAFQEYSWDERVSKILQKVGVVSDYARKNLKSQII